MSTPIAPTPTLKGKDAKRLLRDIKKAESKHNPKKENFLKECKEVYNSTMTNLKEKVEEWFEEFIEAREGLRRITYRINILGDEDNKDKAFEELSKARDTFHCLRDEGYIINGLQKKALDKAKIKYKLVRK